ncbi:MAG: hypothetical protein NVS1B1_03190 [Candidatus Limnocylindrales bacterium]
MTRLRLRPSTGAVRGQTRAYAERVDELVALLRREIGAPAEARGGPALVVLMGVPGVGKSHCARLIGARLGAAHIATDQLRSRLFIAASYAEEENATIFRCVEALVDQLLGEGHRVIVDATNLIARNRKATVAVARRHRVPLVFGASSRTRRPSWPVSTGAGPPGAPTIIRMPMFGSISG